jgi:putative membrane protein
MIRHRLFILAAAMLVVAAFACRSDEKVNSGAAGTTDTSTTSTSGTDTSGTTTTSAAASATTTGSTGGTVSNLSAADKEFVMKAAQGGMAEVQLGQIASAKGVSADVQTFGNRMVTDHSKANDELKQLVTTKGLAMPADAGPEHQKTINTLSKKSAKDFDREYMSDMVDDHEKDVKEFEKASKDAKDSDIRTWASKTLPTLQEHLRMAKDTLKKVR